MKYYFYLINQGNQIFVEVKDLNNYSERKIKNAISNKAFELMNINTSEVTKEDIRNFKKGLKTRIFDTCTLDAGYNNIEVIGNFEKTEEKTVTFNTLMKDGTTQQRKGIKLHSKVLNDYIYIEKRVLKGADDESFNRYYIYYKGMLLTDMKTKNINKIDAEIERLDSIFNIKETFENKLNETNNKTEKINTSNTTIENTNNKEVKYFIKDTETNRQFKPELIGKIFNGIVSGEYTGLQVENNTIWFLSEDVLEVNSSNISTIEKKIKQNTIKINLLDNKINRILDKRDIIKVDAVNQGIRLNDKSNILIQQLFKLDYEIDILENRIDTLKANINSLKGILYNISLYSLKAEYGANKYKIINRLDNTITYSNNINEYIDNFNYNIKVLINNIEYVKQQYYPKNKCHKHYSCDTISYLNDSLKVIYYDKNDTIAKINKYYHIDNNKNTLLIEEYLKKNKTTVHYMKSIAGSYISINYLSINKVSDELYNDTMKLFADNKNITDMLYTAYNKHKEYLKNYNKASFNDKKEIYIKHYAEIVNKYPKLKKVADNISYYNDLYKNNIYEFYKKYNTNEKNWNNYLFNYNELKKLLKLDNTIKEYDFKSPAKVVYTTNYRK